MPFIIGTDEAGYAPPLGPLVISITVWRVPDHAHGADLYQLLKKVVARKPPGPNGRPRLAIADSKALYNPGIGLGMLERGVLAALSLSGNCPVTCGELWNFLGADSIGHRCGLPWPADDDCRLPLVVDVDDLVGIAARVAKAMNALSVQLCAIRSIAVFPQRLNELIDECGNKGEALSRLTLGLVNEAIAKLPEEPVIVFCDKHGGRNRYSRLLQLHFPDDLVEVYGECMEESVYRWGPPSRRIEARFCVRGERFLPVALASMVSKYVRELAMREFNQFWCRQVPELRPTAGYPTDAWRFKKQISAVQAKLGIEDRILWRCR